MGKGIDCKKCLCSKCDKYVSCEECNECEPDAGMVVACPDFIEDKMTDEEKRQYINHAITGD